MSADMNGVDPLLVSGFMQLAQVCKISATSGYRDTAKQAESYQEYLEGKNPYPVAKPGSSNHERGLAIDVDGDLACAHANAARFGLHFPFGNDPIHMELAGQGSTQDKLSAAFTQKDGATPQAVPSGDPVMRAIAGVTAALRNGPEDAPDTSIEGLGAAVGKQPAAPETPTTTGGKTTGGKTTGGQATGSGFYEKLLNRLGMPVSPENIRFMQAWAQAEGMPAGSNNPFATTQSGPGIAGVHNSVGVKLYTDENAGVENTYTTLVNGRYGGILDALKRSDPAGAAVALEQSPWGTGSLVRKILGV